MFIRLNSARVRSVCYDSGYMDADKKTVTLDELGEMLTHVVTHMATKEDIADLRMELKRDIADVRKEMATKVELAEVKSELAIVRHDVEIIKEDTESNKGFAKEIDHTLNRVIAIEKHVGMSA